MFGPTGTYLGQFGSRGTLEGQFRYPFGLAFEPNGNLLVVDSQDNRIQRFGHVPVPARTRTWGSIKAQGR